jgi:hypothetical protein
MRADADNGALADNKNGRNSPLGRFVSWQGGVCGVGLDSTAAEAILKPAVEQTALRRVGSSRVSCEEGEMCC